MAAGHSPHIIAEVQLSTALVLKYMNYLHLLPYSLTFSFLPLFLVFVGISNLTLQIHEFILNERLYSSVFNEYMRIMTHF